MKTALIIPLYKQSKYLSRILEGIEKQTVKPDLVCLVFDRPKDDADFNAEEIGKIVDNYSIEINVTQIHEHSSYIGNPPNGKELFLTPLMRNKGISAALIEGCDQFIFIDGDCIPQPSLVASHIKKLSANVPVLTVGRRRESKYRWQDQRENEPNLCHLELFRKDGVLINNPELLRQSLIVWSCNIGLNLQAVQILRKFNDRYFNRREVFSSAFNGKWGGEDGFLGIEAWHCKIFITTLGEKGSGVEHIDHPRPKDKYNINHRDFFDEQVRILRELVKVKPLNLDFFMS